VSPESGDRVAFVICAPSLRSARCGGFATRTPRSPRFASAATVAARSPVAVGGWRLVIRRHLEVALVRRVAGVDLWASVTYVWAVCALSDGGLPSDRRGSGDVIGERGEDVADWTHRAAGHRFLAAISFHSTSDRCFCTATEPTVLAGAGGCGGKGVGWRGRTASTV
jgi:hypothetical protein